MYLKRIIKALALGLAFMVALVFCACSTNKKVDNKADDSVWTDDNKADDKADDSTWTDDNKDDDSAWTDDNKDDDSTWTDDNKDDDKDDDSTWTDDNKADDLWTNDNAVYAYVKAGFENDILKDVEGAFESLHFQKVYVTAKNTNGWTPLRLLFVLEKDGTENIQDFIRLLQQDERINGASPCRDIAFETVDTRYIEKEKDTIAVGEEMRLTLKGSRDAYIQPFDFGGLYAKPSIGKNYSVEDFVGIDLKSVTMNDNGWLYLELVEENYFNVIKAADILSRLPEMEEVDFDTSNVTIPIPPIWEISDETVASLDMDTNGDAIIRGLKPGEVTVELAGVSCRIKVN